MTGIKQLNLKKLFNNYTLTVIIPIILFWFILFLLGYPKPSADDLYFIGAPMNLVKNGEFLNPLLREWYPQTVDRFFVQPPFYSRILAPWLATFGINTTSLLFFQFLCYITFSITTSLILKKYGFSKIIVFLFIFLYSTFIIYSGLRFDALAMAFLTLGLWFLTIDNNLRYFLGFLCLGSSVLTSLIMVSFVFSFGSAIVINNFLQRKISWQNYLREKFLVLLATLVILFILFLAAINWELSRFIADLSWVSSWRRGETIFTILNIPSFSRKLLVLPLWFAMLSSFAFVIISKKIKYQDKFICITFLIGIILNLFIYVNSGSLFYQFNYFCWLLLIVANNAIFKIIDNGYKLILITLSIIIFFMNQSLNIISFISSQDIPKRKYEMLKQEMQTIPNNKVFAIDEVAARYIFNYEIPDNALDANWSGIAIETKPEKIVLVISSKKTTWVKGLPDFEKAELFGYKFNTIPKYPEDVIIIK